jgi:aspartyl-tRNA(Asn)/glutamyl-tRNA(Gln) amidotransferase subunit A
MTALNAMATLAELSTGLEEGRWSATGLASFYLQRIERAAQLHAFVSVDGPGVLRAAAESDERRAAGRAFGPLDGLPIAVKDLCDIEGEVTTGGSAAWRKRRSAGTADAVLRLKDQGMVVLGKTHMTEFAFGLWGTNPLMGTPWNPWDVAQHRVPGGSSSGSAVAVAAGLAPAAIGSDTGGSVRVPAALNGITGLKTTWGLVGLGHTLALSPTLDSIGPMCHTVVDARWLTEVLKGDLGDAQAARTPAVEGLAGRRIVVMDQQEFPCTVDTEVLRVFRETSQWFADLGAEVMRRPLPFDLGELARLNAQLIAAEAWEIHRSYVDDPSLAIGPWVRQRVQAGKAITAGDKARALEGHREHCKVWSEWLGDCDAFLLPATPTTACPVESVNETISPHASFARAANYLGACALALPAGMCQAGLPIGMQLMAKARDEETLFELGEAFQSSTSWHRLAPDLSRLGL